MGNSSSVEADNHSAVKENSYSKRLISMALFGEQGRGA
jgi:hypothetical protein